MESDTARQSAEQEAWVDIRRILDAQRFAVLSTHDQGQPYASLVAFSATDDLRQVLFCTPRSTRKYANLSCDGRAAMLVHTSRNTPADCEQAMSVTATGTAVEVPGRQKETVAAFFLARHPELAGFVGDPANALLALQVSEYHLVRRFQDVVRLGVVQASGEAAHGRGDDAM
jgi:nitroimidazol reductase NimA-like FMN-containing flavoprotein (pyridoxamine 5'-phosphate oxidase superfamily)